MNIRSFCITIVLGCSPFCIEVWGQEIYDNMFDIDRGSNSLFWNEYAGKIDENFFLPDTIQTKGGRMAVKCIDLGAFKNRKELKRIRLPECLEIIGSEAFHECINLESIYLPSKVDTIDKDAFMYTNLLSATVDVKNPYFDSRDSCNAIIKSSTNTIVVGTASTMIPHSVISVGENAFAGRRNLKKVLLPSNLRTIGKEAFLLCTELEDVSFENPQYTDAEGIQEIGVCAFSGCVKLAHIDLPTSLRTIQSWAFNNTGLRSIFIPSNVDSIEVAPFSMCHYLESIEVAPDCKKYDSRNNCNAIIEKNSLTLISGCNKTTIPHGVIKIGQNAFEGMIGITSMHIPDGVREIEENVFYGCKNLESIILPKSITHLLECFGGCEKLKQVTILSRKPPFILISGAEVNAVTLYVPKGCVQRYQQSEGWNMFGEIREIKE